MGESTTHTQLELRSSIETMNENTERCTTSYAAVLTETGWEWYQRSRQRRQRRKEPPENPSAAAWAFVRGSTGITFLDAALRSSSRTTLSAPMSKTAHTTTAQSTFVLHPTGTGEDHAVLPVIDVRGISGVGKTWTIITIIARYVTATRPSRFLRGHDSTATTTTTTSTTTTSDSPVITATTTRDEPKNRDESSPTQPYFQQELDSQYSPLLQPQLPQVIVLDSQLDITPSKLAYAIRACLLRERHQHYHQHDQQQQQQQQQQRRGHRPQNYSDNYHDNEERLAQELQDCLRRIHVATTPTDWPALLEHLRSQLQPSSAATAVGVPGGGTTATTRTNATIMNNILGEYGATDTPHHPTLVVWDGFLSERDTIRSERARMPILTSLQRWLEDGTVWMVITTTTAASSWNGGSSLSPAYSNEWERRITHRIWLQPSNTGNIIPVQQGARHRVTTNETDTNHAATTAPAATTTTIHATHTSGVATILMDKFSHPPYPFTITVAGILS